MAENDAVTEPGAEPDTEAPSLELPSLFGRRKKRAPKPSSEPASRQEHDGAATAAVPVATVQVEEPTQVISPVSVAEPIAEPVPEPVAEPVAEPEPEPEPEHDAKAVAEPEPVVLEPEPVVLEPEPVVLEPEPVAVEEVEERAPHGATAVTALPEDEEHDEYLAEEVEDPAPRPRRTAPRLPALAASTAAIAVGAVVGLLGCALTFLGLKLCEVITSTDSCGGPGLLLLIVIVVVMILVGAALLRLFTVEDAGNLSFLGVGITVAVVLMFLLDYLYQPWMFVVMPALTAVAFALARWITTRYVEDVLADDDDSEVHDIR